MNEGGVPRQYSPFKAIYIAGIYGRRECNIAAPIVANTHSVVCSSAQKKQHEQETE